MTRGCVTLERSTTVVFTDLCPQYIVLVKYQIATDRIDSLELLKIYFMNGKLS